MSRRPSERFRAELPIAPQRLLRDGDLEAQQMASYKLTTVLPDPVPVVWREAARRLLFGTPQQVLPVAYGVVVYRTVFAPHHLYRKVGGGHRPQAPRFHVFVSVGVVPVEDYVETARVGQTTLSIRRLLPSATYWQDRPFAPALRDDDALRAMGMRWLVICQQAALRLRELAAERGVRLNPRAPR